jgi:hypothetical protein
MRRRKNAEQKGQLKDDCGKRFSTKDSQPPRFHNFQASLTNNSQRWKNGERVGAMALHHKSGQCSNGAKSPFRQAKIMLHLAAEIWIMSGIRCRFASMTTKFVCKGESKKKRLEKQLFGAEDVQADLRLRKFRRLSQPAEAVFSLNIDGLFVQMTRSTQLMSEERVRPEEDATPFLHP